MTFEYSGLKHFIRWAKWQHLTKFTANSLKEPKGSVSNPTETLRMWPCPILQYLNFCSYLCVPKWSLVPGQMLLPLLAPNPKLHKKYTEPSSVALLFDAQWITAAGSVSLADEMETPGSIRDWAFQPLRGMQQGRLEQLYKYVVFSRSLQENTDFPGCCIQRLPTRSTGCRAAEKWRSAFFCFAREINDTVERRGK